jgi:hypothetical protein
MPCLRESPATVSSSSKKLALGAAHKLNKWSMFQYKDNIWSVHLFRAVKMPGKRDLRDFARAD